LSSGEAAHAARMSLVRKCSSSAMIFKLGAPMTCGRIPYNLMSFWGREFFLWRSF
jgi:hypothetical protein